ncbi:MAG: aminopeptidase N [Bdellovibrio sp.]|nr:MAG: aminopeptidase N [Bdellovibrio sp.]
MAIFHLKDYKPPGFLIESTTLRFDLHESETFVRSKIRFHRQDSSLSILHLDGVELEALEFRLNGRSLATGEYELREEGVRIHGVPEFFELESLIRIHPEQNTTCEGLYRSGPLFLTQCEAQGFRRLCYYLDRPDVMAPFEVTIEADRDYPVLLSNGDCLAKGNLANGRHEVTWKDPHKKPSYLFALVAGNLGVLEDRFETRAGRPVSLRVYAEKSQIPRCRFAMESLKKAMRWDEDRYGLEYDLSNYMIVAANDFNAAAMENKSLNIFNTRLILADPATATDANYEAIDSVVAHEYFHNWTGNRITLRDWFHLSLKEGLTVFRDQEFSGDMISQGLVRIDTVTDLRENQFAEDKGPNAHPVLPESGASVDNFFTATIYEKGAEVIRMMQTMVGRPGFRRGMDLYIQRHDGQAVTIGDFADAIAEANGEDWRQFKLWYSQAGTPRLRVEEEFREDEGIYVLHLTQSCPATPGQKEKKPLHLPLALAFFAPQGQEIEPLSSAPNDQVGAYATGGFGTSAEIVRNSEGARLFHLRTRTARLQFTNCHTRPILSLNRGFSAPIEVDWDRSSEDLLFLYLHETDAFNRWDAGQVLMAREIQRLLQQVGAFGTSATQVGAFGTSAVADEVKARDPWAALPKSVPPAPPQTPRAVFSLNPSLLAAFQKILLDENEHAGLRSRLLAPPSISYLAQSLELFDPEVFERSYHMFLRSYGCSLASACRRVYDHLHGRFDDRTDPEARGFRGLKNWALHLLGWAGEGIEIARRQCETTRLMTDREEALAVLAQHAEAEGQKALRDFFSEWKHESLVLNKYWTVQAALRRPDTFARVISLSEDPHFPMRNPNAVYSLLGVFGDNLTQFHREPAAGSPDPYSFMSEKILALDRLNPQVAARLSSCFDFCPRQNPSSRARARQALGRTLNEKLSANVRELLARTLKVLEGR